MVGFIFIDIWQGQPPKKCHAIVFSIWWLEQGLGKWSGQTRRRWKEQARRKAVLNSNLLFMHTNQQMSHEAYLQLYLTI